MKALRKLEQGPGRIEVREVEVPRPGPGEAVLRVRRGGVCFTDIHIWHGHFGKLRPPVTLGHECCGEVAETGPGVEGFTPGDRVTVESEVFSCGQCRFCRAGRTHLCDRRVGMGYATDGAFALYVKVRAAGLHRLPEPVSFTAGALCEPLAVAAHAVLETASPLKGKLVLVTGPGTIGLLVLQVARTAGAQVVVTGTSADLKRLELAARLGARRAVNIQAENLADLTREMTSGYGFEAAFDCSGNPAGVRDAVANLGKGGELVQVGLTGREIPFDLDQVTLKELTLKGTFAHHHRSWLKALDLLRQGRVDLESLVSGEYPLARWEEAFKLAESGAGVKYLLIPEE